MPGVLPDGEPVPADGSLPPQALAEPDLSSTPFAFYIHVPYCASRCGYCDFNTYTASELGGGASQATYGATAIEEIRLARKVLGGTGTDLPVQTVFFGGGTPTMLPAADLVALLGAVRDEFGLAADAEVTTEANPESVNPAYLAELRAGGFNRISFGMQSAREHVLRILDRRHTPGRPEACVREAREAGFEHVNLDLIYGTPGESDDDWRASLDAAIGAAPDHVSRVLAHRRGRHPAGRPGQARRAADDRRRRPRRPLPDRRRGARRRRLLAGTRSRTGPPRRRAVRGTTCSTGPAPTGGASAPARTATSAAPAGGT